MGELLTLVAFGLLVLGVVGSVVPLVPGALASLGGVLVYWWSTGYTVPGPLVLVALVVLALVAVVVDYVGGALSARAGGASTRTTVVAAVVGFVLVFVAGPVGLVAGVAGTVYLLEYRNDGDHDDSLRAAAYATVGVLASAAVQLVVTVALLAAMVVVVLL